MAGKLDVYDVIVLTIHANNNRLSGRMTLQSLIYFETLKIKDLAFIEYCPYFCGPFSDRVVSALYETVAFSQLAEHVTFRYRPETYRYELTESGTKYASDTKVEHSASYDVICGIVDTCREHCDLSITPLSNSTKSHYILHNKNNDQCTFSDVCNLAKGFGWQLLEEDVENGMKLLEKLKLNIRIQ